MSGPRDKPTTPPPASTPPRRSGWEISDADLAALEIDPDRTPLWAHRLFRMLGGLAADVGALKAALAPDVRDNVIHRLEKVEGDVREVKAAQEAFSAKGRLDLWTGARWVVEGVLKGGGALLVAWLLIQAGTCAPPSPRAPAPAVAPAP